MDNTFLITADEDNDFEHDHKLKPQLKFARRVHVYHSGDEHGLVISSVTKGSPDRSGYGGLRSFSGVSSRCVQIDCLDVDDTGFLQVNHHYCRHPEIVGDVEAVLAGECPESIRGHKAVELGRRYCLMLDCSPPS
ncbi:MAG: hypothetical protein OXG71_03145 [Rhodospirillales bacterium]|nr:hypothetical protein [Rhodospirillales bacterium]